MKRRNFIKTISAASLAATAFPKSLSDKSNSKTKSLIKPARLKQGDTIAIVTPGSYITEEEKEESINKLTQSWFQSYILGPTDAEERILFCNG